MVAGTGVDGKARRRSVAAGVLLGVGLGGFFDGIVLHQILQWHHMISGPTPPGSLEGLRANTLGDGLFHAATWVVTVAGVFLLATTDGARQAHGRRRLLLGAGLSGWGGFNLLEGLVDHHLLRLHHVRPGPDEFLYDLGFLAWGAVMLVAGVALVRSASRRGAGLPRD